jgi:hypothetical protein
MRINPFQGQTALEFLAAVFVATLVLAWSMGKLSFPGIQHSMSQAAMSWERPLPQRGAPFLDEQLGRVKKTVFHSVVNVPGEFVHVQRTLGYMKPRGEALPRSF